MNTPIPDTQPPPKRLRRLSSVWAGHDATFLTLCTHNREKVLANDSVFERAVQFSEESLARYGVWVDCLLLMPDHLHCIVTLRHGAESIGCWVKAFKFCVGRREFRWQSGFFDHILRSHESRSEKWEYIRLNPVRAGLVSDADAWPYALVHDPRDGRRVRGPGLQHVPMDVGRVPSRGGEGAGSGDPVRITKMVDRISPRDEKSDPHVVGRVPSRGGENAGYGDPARITKIVGRVP